MSLLSVALMLAVLVFIASAAFKMVPHYFDYMSLDKIITSVEAERGGDMRTLQDFRAYVGKGGAVNRIDGLDLEMALAVRVDGDYFLVRLNYEKRESLIGNLDLVATFDKEYRLRMP
jgi:hypothetical protein